MLNLQLYRHPKNRKASQSRPPSRANQFKITSSNLMNSKEALAGTKLTELISFSKRFQEVSRVS